MDFKVAGTSEFVTAIQLDTKLDGIPASVLAGALTQAKDARTTILAVLNAAIDGPDEMAPTAPRVISVQIPVDKIGELIGPKGKTINAIQDETGADISIEEDGTVYIGATDGPSAEAARAQVNAIANPTNPEVGEQFLGTVVKIAAFGAFISLLPGKDGLLHISEVRKLAGGKRVENVEDVLGVGQKILVEITKIDDRGKLSLAPVLAEEADTDGPRGDRHARRRARRGCRRLVVSRTHGCPARFVRAGHPSSWAVRQPASPTSGRRSMTGTCASRSARAASAAARASRRRRRRSRSLRRVARCRPQLARLRPLRTAQSASIPVRGERSAVFIVIPSGCLRSLPRARAGRR